MAGFKKGIKSGIYNPINPDKWVITESFDSKSIKQIKYRSSWEKKFFLFMDINDNIIKCNSEGMIIPYISPVDNKYHRYYMDAMMQTKDGTIWLIEIKPYAQCFPPKLPKNNTEKSRFHYEKAIMTYVVNQAKWEATEILCQEKGWRFKIITEKELGL